MIAPIFALPHVPVAVEVETRKAMLAERYGPKPEKPPSKYRQKIEARRSKIIEMAQAGFNGREIAKELRCCSTTPYRVCRGAGIKMTPPPRGPHKKTMARRAKLRKMFNAGASGEEIRRALGVSHKAMLVIARDIGCDIVTQDRAARNARIIKLANAGTSPAEISHIVGLSCGYVFSLIRESSDAKNTQTAGVKRRQNETEERPFGRPSQGVTDPNCAVHSAGRRNGGGFGPRQSGVSNDPR